MKNESRRFSVIRNCLLALMLLTSWFAHGSLPENIPERMASAAVPGVSIAVIKAGEITDVVAYGTSGGSKALVPDDIFEAASNGKVIAAYRIFSLLEAGLVSLNDTIIDERVETECGAVTLGEVLSHTSGLGNNIDADSFSVNCEQKGSFSYSGQGYLLLAAVIENATGRDSGDDIRETLFEPLAMRHSTMGRNPLNLVTGHPDLVFGVLTQRGPARLLLIAEVTLLTLIILALAACFKWIEGKWRFLAMPVSTLALLVMFVVAAARIQIPVTSLNRDNDIASSLKSSAPDMAMFLLEMMKPTLLEPARRDEMFTPIVRVNNRVSWSYGLGIDDTDGIRTWWHWGSNPGFQSLIVMVPDTQSGVVILTNGGGFADFALEGRGGYFLARSLAADILDVDGHWSIAPP